MMGSDDLHLRIAAAARDLQDESDTQHTLDRSVKAAIEVIPHVHYAGVSIARRKGAIDTPAFSHELVRRGDELQYELQEGPCLDAVWHHDTVISPDLMKEERWSRWAPRVAAELQVRSVLCLQLFTSADVVGALSLYSKDVDAFDHTHIDIATSMAAHIAVAVAGTQTEDQLRVSVVNRTLIGQAQGIMMERFGLDSQRAFDVLVRVSQDLNIKVLQVADELVRTRITPGTSRSTHQPRNSQ